MKIEQALTTQLTQVPKAGSDKAQVEASFGDVLSSLVNNTNSAQQQADAAIEQLHAGGEQSLHDAMLSMGKGRYQPALHGPGSQQGLDAYQEVMRMQV